MRCPMPIAFMFAFMLLAANLAGLACPAESPDPAVPDTAWPGRFWQDWSPPAPAVTFFAAAPRPPAELPITENGFSSGAGSRGHAGPRPSARWSWLLPAPRTLPTFQSDPAESPGTWPASGPLAPDSLAPRWLPIPAPPAVAPAPAPALPEWLRGLAERRLPLGRSAYLHLGQRSRFHFEFRRAAFELRILSGRRIGLTIHFR